MEQAPSSAGSSWPAILRQTPPGLMRSSLRFARATYWSSSSLPIHSFRVLFPTGIQPGLPDQQAHRSCITAHPEVYSGLLFFEVGAVLFVFVAEGLHNVAVRNQELRDLYRDWF